MLKHATIRLTILYSLIFIGFLVLFSSGLYFWVNTSLGESYVEQVRGQAEQTGQHEANTLQSQTAQIAADLALNNFRTILLTVDAIGIVIVPLGAYILTRRTLQPLVRSQEQQKQFIANAAHELRTPLAVLNGELELALRKPHSTGDYKKTLASSKQEVDRMTQLTSSLLLLAQLDEKPSAPLDKTLVPIRELLQTIQQQLAAKAAQHNIRLHVDCPPEVSVRANAALLSIAISNIIDNAIKHSPPDNDVSITVIAIAGDHTLLTISDHGSGISTSQQAHLFERFYQGDSSRTRDGFGLGLAIVQKIIVLHGGKISFTTSPDGTIFRIQL